VIKAIFFDWFNTLARFDPPRSELYRKAFQQFGIELTLEQTMRGVLTADRYYFEENARRPADERSPAEQMELYSCYPEAIVAEAGIKVAEDLPLKVLKVAWERFQGLTFVLFDDVLSTLQTLKGRGLILGVLTNANKDMQPINRKLGLEGLLDFFVTSREAGADKPKPPMFLAALDRAGVEAGEAVHVGDQYEIDVVGARGVGVSPILIDRYDLYPDFADCPRIRSLTEVAERI